MPSSGKLLQVQVGVKTNLKGNESVVPYCGHSGQKELFRFPHQKKSTTSFDFMQHIHLTQLSLVFYLYASRPV